MSAIFDRFSKRFERREEQKKLSREVVDPDAPPIPDAPVEQVHAEKAPARNDPCPCGSGKKYKKCCGKAP